MEMSNSNKDNLEDAAESAPKLNEDAKPSKFNKTKSISEVFSKLELSEDLEEDSVDDIVSAHDDSDVIIPVHDEIEEIAPVHDDPEEIIPVHDEVEELDDTIQIHDEEDEIIPIHNEYQEDDAYSNEISEGGLILNPVDDEGPQEESDSDKEKSDDSLNLKSDKKDDDEAISDEISPELFKNDDIEEDSMDHTLDDEELESAKPSSEGVIINSNTEDDDEDSRSFNSSLIFTGIGFVLGLLIFIYGLIYYTTASDRVVDNVLSGETAGMAVMIIIIGLIILAFSALSFISSRKSSKLMDAFSDIRSIDYDEIKNDTFSRDDFESAFTNVFKKNNKENEDDNTPINDESEGSAEASIGSLFGSLRKGKTSKSSSQSDENPESSSSNKFKSADDFDSYIEPIHTESSAQDSIFNNSDTQDGSIDDSLDDSSSDSSGDSSSDSSGDSIVDESPIDDSSSLSEPGVESEFIGDIQSRVVDEDEGFEVFVPDSNSDAVDVDAIKADSIHKFKKSLNLDDILDDGGEDEKSSDVENSDKENI